MAGTILNIFLCNLLNNKQVVLLQKHVSAKRTGTFEGFGGVFFARLACSCVKEGWTLATLSSSRFDSKDLIGKHLCLVFNPVIVLAGGKQVSSGSSWSRVLWGFPLTPMLAITLPLGRGQRVWSNSLLKLYSSPLPTGSDHENCTAGPSSVELQPTTQFLCFWAGAEEAFWLLMRTSTAFSCKRAEPFLADPNLNNPQHYFIFSFLSNYSKAWMKYVVGKCSV